MEREICAVMELTSSSSAESSLPETHHRGRSRSRGRGRGRSARSKAQRLRKKKPPVDDAVAIQCMLSKKCVGEGGSCRDVFRNKKGLEELVKFRSAWKERHKADQDEAAPRMFTMKSTMKFSMISISTFNEVLTPYRSR